LGDVRRTLPLPAEPADLRAETRALLEDCPEEGAHVIGAAAFVADLLWSEWAEDLEGAGMDRDRFLEISRDYSGELRLWVVGERPWDHCAAGLSGRVRRRLPEGSPEVNG
jgi:hypothetical protein